jgi:Xaa-Pro dipeptidase
VGALRVPLVQDRGGIETFETRVQDHEVRVGVFFFFFPLVRGAVHSTVKIYHLRYFCYSDAHIHVMKHARPGVMEYQLEAEFRYHAHFHGGCREMSYTCICGSGENGAVLHYGHAGLPNNKQVQKDDMLLLDMGAEYHCYGADVTRSFPASGKFSAQQRTIYSAVLASQQAVMDAVKPGVRWQDMHELSYKVILEHMQLAGLIVKGANVQEMLDNDIGALFMPHGLGHLLGIDTHDVGGFLKDQTRLNRPGFRSLRCYRTLEAGMVLTVEPGIYFNTVVFENAFNTPEKAKYLVREEIEKFFGFGGVRIEDDIVVTATGCENMTTAPRQIDEIEAILAQNPFINPKH